MKVNRICVFCGAKPGVDDKYIAATHALAAEFKERDIHLVYGGGGLGLMGEIARSCLSHHLEVDGVIPRSVYVTYALW